MLPRFNRRKKLLVAALLGCLAIVAQEHWPQSQPKGEYYFVRMEYQDHPNIRRRFSRGWWRQDWPEADIHFTQGIRRLTRLDVGDGRHMPLTDDRIFDHPWMYATQVAYWDLSNQEIERDRKSVV